MRQRDDDLTVRRERTSQRPDGAAEFDQARQIVGDALRDVGHDLRVQLLKLALDSLKGTEVARDDPLDHGCDKRRGVERTNLTSTFGALAELLEHFDLRFMSCHDPVRAEHAFDGTQDRFTPLAAGHVQRHMQMLACVHQRRAARLLEKSLCLLVAEFERLLHGRNLLLGRVAQCEPEQRVVGEPVECGRQVLFSPGLSFVEHEEREHLHAFQRTLLSKQALPPARLELALLVGRGVLWLALCAAPSVGKRSSVEQREWDGHASRFDRGDDRPERLSAAITHEERARPVIGPQSPRKCAWGRIQARGTTPRSQSS